MISPFKLHREWSFCIKQWSLERAIGRTAAGRVRAVRTTQRSESNEMTMACVRVFYARITNSWSRPDDGGNSFLSFINLLRW